MHKKLFGRIDEVCDVAYMLKSIKSKVESRKSRCEFIFEKDFDKVVSMLNERIGCKDTDTQRLQSGDWSQQKSQQKKTVVLFESRGAGVVMKRLQNYF